LDESFYACRNATWKHGHVEEYIWVSGVMLVTVGVLNEGDFADMCVNLFSLLMLIGGRA
jgi:hypothetical protein